MRSRWGSWDFDTHPDTIRALGDGMAHCDVCDRAIPRRTPECRTCGLAVCDGCRDGAEHAEYHAAIVADDAERAGATERRAVAP